MSKFFKDVKKGLKEAIAYTEGKITLKTDYVVTHTSSLKKNEKNSTQSKQAIWPPTGK